MQTKQKIDSRSIKQYLLQKPHFQQLADGKLAYIAAQKQSVSGMFNNDRFMFINGKDLTFGYSNDLPLSIPIGSFLKIRNIKKQAHLGDVLIQRSKHKLKAIEISVQKFWYKDREEKIPEVWVFIMSSTKAADDSVNLFNSVKAEVLAKQIIPIPKMVQTILTLPSQAKGDQEVNNSISIFASENLKILETPSRKKTENKITPQPVIDISIKNKPKYTPCLSINPTYNVVSRPKHIMYSQGHSRYQVEKLSLPAYYNQTVVYPPSYHPYSYDSQDVIIVPYSPKEASHHSIQYPITHHGDSPKMPNSIIINSPERKITKYELQIRPEPVSNSVSHTKYSHPNNSIMSNIPIVVEVSQKQSNSNNERVSSHHSKSPRSVMASYPSNGLVINFESRKHETVVKEPISPISKRQRTKSRYAIDNSQFNSNSSSPNSKRFSNQKQKLINVWDQDSPQLIDFTLKSSPVKNRMSPSKFQQSIQNEQNEIKSNKRRRTEYVVLKDCKDWNQQFFYSLDPLDTVIKFKQFSAQITMQIINSFGSTQKKYHILKQTESQIVYEHMNLIITLGFNPNYDKEHNKYLQKSVQNYIYINEILQNKEFCRVPLVNLIKYKGIFALVKTSLGNSTQINKNSLSNEIKRLQSLTKIPRQQFNRCNFKLVTYFNRGSSSQIIFIDDLQQLIPLAEKNFRKQLIFMAAKQKGLIQSSYLSKLLEKQLDNFLFNLQNLQFSILSSDDLYTQLYKYGIAKQQLGVLYNKASTQFVKQILTSELLSETASDLFSTHLQNQIKSLARKKQKHSDRYLVQAAYEFMDDLCSATKNSEALWDVVTSDTEVKYRIKVERKYLMWGYFLSAFLFKGGLKFNINSLDKSTGFSEEYNCINAHSLEGFECIMTGTELDYLQPISTTRSILFQPPSEFGYQKVRGYLQNSSYFTYIKSTPKYFKQLLVYFSNFIPSDVTAKNIINPYESIPYEPSSLTSIRLNLSKMKWLLKHKDEESAVSLLEVSCEHIGFWGAEIHPLMSEFYDLLASYYVGIGESEEALTLAKSSLVNIVKLVGSNSLAAADKFYFLANVMYNIGKYEQAFGNFSKAREVLLEKSVSSSILGKIQLKIAVLYHHFNKLIDSELAAKQALQIFIFNKQQRYLIETYQLLDKLYRIQNKISLLKQNALDCSSKLQSSRNQQVYSRTIKLSLNPFLAEVAADKKKILLQTIQMLNINLSKREYYTWLFKKSNVLEIVINYLRGIDDMAKDMTIGNMQRYKGINSKTDNHLFIFFSYLEAILGITELTSITGILRSYE